MSDLPTDRPAYKESESATRRAGNWLQRLTETDMAIGPAYVAATYLVFFLAGVSIGGTVSSILHLGKIICWIVGVTTSLILAKPLRGLRVRWGRAGIVGATLLIILASCVAGSVGQIATLSRETVAAYQLESGGTTIVAKGPARGCQIAINEYNLGLLSEAEMREQCGGSLAPAQKGAEDITPQRLRVAKPNPFLFVWAGVQFLVVAAILVFLFKRP